MTLACGALLAALSVWDYPARQPHHEALRTGIIAALRSGNAAQMETLARKGTELLPEDPVWRYNLACAQAKQGRFDDALVDLEQAIRLGYRNGPAIEEDADFRPVAQEARFRRLVDLADELQDKPLPEGPLAVETAKGSVGGTVTLGARNLEWNLDAGCFMARLELRGTGGSGNAGDLYFNRDHGHSVLKTKEFPGLTRVEFDAEGQRRGFDLDFPNTLFPCPVFGNCSRATTEGPYWRSIPRAIVTTESARIPLLYRLYRANQVWVFPIVFDHPPLGKYGDIVPAVTPYCLATEGRSWSDQSYLRAALDVSRYLPKPVKREAVERGLLAPTVQAVLRRALKTVATEDDYLTAKAHPTAFPANGVDLARLRALSEAMTVETLPPVALIAGVVGSKTAVPTRLPELMFASPCAWSFILRAEERERTFVVQLTGGAAYEARAVHGDPAAVRLERLAPDQFKIIVDRTRVTPTGRVDIALFAKSATSGWGAPSFLSFAVVDPQAPYADPFLLGNLGLTGK